MKNRNFISTVLYVSIVLVGLALDSCKEESQSFGIVKVKIVNKDEPIKVELSDLVDSVHYTVLETSDSCLLGEIEDVKKVAGYYFVRDNFGLYAFDDKGRFVNEISHKGNGHEEYVNLDNFYIDESRGLVGLVCNFSKKIMFFSYDGTYHSTIRMKEEDSGMASVLQCPGGGLLAHYPMPNDFNHVSFEYKQAQIFGDSLVATPLVPMKELSTKNVYYAFLFHPMAVYKGACLFLSALSHDVYVYQDGEIKRIYRFDVAKELPSAKEQEGYKNENFFEVKEEIKASGKSVGLTGIQANEDYVFISLNDENMLIWDGEQSILIKNVYDGVKNLYISNMALSGGCEDGNIGFYAADFLCRLKGKLPLGNSVLNKIVDFIDENDNPVLYQFVFKKGLVHQLKKEYGL